MPFITSFNGSFVSGRRPYYRGIPTVLANSNEFLQIWYDLSNESTVNLTGGAVIAVDGIGWASTHDANTSGVSDRPTYAYANRNNLNTAIFDGTSDYFTINPFTNFSPGGIGISGYTMFVVNKFDDTDEQRLTETDATGTSDMGFGINASGKWEYYIGGGTYTGSDADTDWHVHSFVYDGSQADSSEFNAWVDNTAITGGTETSSIGDSALTDTTIVYIGTDENTSLWFDGTLGEIIFFTRALTDAEVNAVNLYLMTKWGVASGYSPTYSNPWDPSTDITPALWYDASDTSSYTLSGSTLSTVTDKAGNFTVSITGSPTRVSGVLNSLNVWDFDTSGSNQNLTTGSGPYASSGDHWAIGVFQWHSTDNTKDSFWSADGTRTYAVSSSQSNNTWTGEIDYDGSNSIVTGTAKNNFTSSIAQNTWAIVSIVFNKTGNQIFGRLDGTTATSTDPYNLSMDTTVTDVRMMRNRGGVHLDGRMAEYFHVAGAPGTGGTDITDVQKAEGYLAHKWGLTANLPVSHPYKSSAP